MGKIYYNGNILTMVADGDFPTAIMTEEGKIRAAGSKEELESLADGKSIEYVNLEGKTLLPAFIDSHSHITQMAQNLNKVDLTSTKSFDEIGKRIREFMQRHQIRQGEYIQGFGYDHTMLREQKHPAREFLDEVCPNNPIFISHISMHMGVANSKALERANITKDSPVGPKLLGRDPNTGELTGFVAEMGMYGIYKDIASLPIDMPTLIDQAQEIYLKYGITTVQDGASSMDVFTMLKGLADAQKLKLDINVYPMAEENSPKEFLSYKEYTKNYKDHLKLAGVKMVLDGSPQGKTAWMSEPYTDGTNGTQWMPDEEVESLAKMAVDHGFQLLVHCNGDASCEQYLRAYEKAYRSSNNPDKAALRPVMIHCQTVRRDQLKRFEAIHMIPSIFVEHVHRWGDIHLKNMGKERAQNISPAAWAKELGLPYTFHQDSPILPPDMLRTVQTAVERQTLSGITLGEKQKITVFDALEAVTKNAAYQYHEEAEKGTIEQGKKADFVILDKNPLTVDIAEIEKIKVLTTIKNDEILYQNEE